MDVGLHEGSQSSINQPVALNAAPTFEGVGDNCHFEVPHPVA